MTNLNSRDNFTHRLYADKADVKAGTAPRLAVLEEQHPVVACIQHRADKFLGSMATGVFEITGLDRYSVSHKVRPHVDAALEPLKDKRTGRLFNRRTSFFVYVYASPDLEGGETFFPHISMPDKTAFNSSFIESRNNASGAPALAVKPFTGSAIFWIGLKPDGSPDARTVHEGLPVRRGDKIGMNIWAKHYLD